MNNTFTKTAIAVMTLVPNLVLAANLNLDGQSLTLEQVVSAATGDVHVSLTKAAQQRVQQSHQLLLEAGRQGVAIYGLTVGVGKSKDTKIFGDDGRLTPSAIEMSQLFNQKMLLTHSAATGAAMPNDVVRAAMVIRLNQIATGHVGVHPDVVRIYQEFINHDIIPVIPEDGSVGAADISLASHIGSAMMGHWEVHYQGQRMPAVKALQQAGIKPLVPYAKDSLSILSTNSVSAARLALALAQSKNLIEFSPQLVSFSLEALNGNISPLLPHSIDARPMPFAKQVAEQILVNLDGSYLFEQDNKRAIQDPLSFRQAHWPIASAYAGFESLTALLELHINSSDDNPVISVGATAGDYGQHSQVGQYFIQGDNISGAINSVANFDMTPIAANLEGYLLNVAQLGKFSSHRSLKLFDGYFTQLPRGLVAPENDNGQGFYAMPNGHVALVAKLAHTVTPASFYGTETQSGIEDTYTNLALLAANLGKANDLITRIYAFELMQSAQALDIRSRHFQQQASTTSQMLLNDYRKMVPYYDSDRLISSELQQTIDFIEQRISR
ncbi:aromatic amino acid ammonia-lyase [Ferrimonas senticii]|uniref:aromatic amino acid ammonia-lyase n=1 Tax=Ferrimonas senticii TaxID=394566 RepID=UPI0004046955|nr:aromatic amino acid ammonia-lyase [Ferrimonas senticii]